MNVENAGEYLNQKKEKESENESIIIQFIQSFEI